MEATLFVTIKFSSSLIINSMQTLDSIEFENKQNDTRIRIYVCFNENL